MFKNINNQNVDGFEIGLDGIVYGYSANQPNLSLDRESCTALGFSFDSVCRWGNPSGIANNIDIPLSTTETFDLVKEDGCTFLMELEYIIFIDQNATASDFATNITDFNFGVSISRGLSRRMYMLYDDGFINRVNNNIETGVYVNSNFVSFGNAVSNLTNTSYQLKNYRSNWVKVSIPITNISTTETNLVFGMVLNNAFKGVSLKIDNVKIYKICGGYKTIINEISINPSFEFERVVDNKKSWTNEDDFRKPRFNKDRYSNYHTKDDRLVINSKELEVDLNFKKAFNELLFNYCKKVDFLRMLPTEIRIKAYSSLDNFIEVMDSDINSPRNYRVTDLHPLLDTLRHSFLMNTSFGMEDISKMVNKVDKYWLDIIAQFVPSTSIWESNIVISNNSICNQKFQYKRYTLEPLGSGSISTNINVDVQIDSSVGYSQVNDVPMTIKNYSNGSEFYGTITIT